MGITKQALDQAYANFKSKYGGLREDYFAALYLAEEFGKKVEDIAHQVAFGNNDYGFDAFYVDAARRNLYLYQFKWTTSHSQFKDTFKRLISAGMERVFGNPQQDPKTNEVLLQLKSALHENQALIDRVYIRFVFNGDPAAAEQSDVLDSLREDLESKKYLIDGYFAGRDVTLTIQFISNETKKKTHGTSWKTHRYDLAFPSCIESRTERGELLHVGFVSLYDLWQMYREMGHRLFERNIRAGLSDERPVNRALRGAFKDVLDNKAIPHAFVFNHNGVTIFAEKMDFVDDRAVLTEPRVLNGAQTITSFAKFIELNEGNKSLQSGIDRLKAIRVLAKVVSGCEQDFITAVTINTNRQNPVEPVNLRASDEIQLELRDKLRDELKIFYERQDNAFANLSDDELTEMGIEQYKAIHIRKLAQTFLASQGEIDRMSRLNEVFEGESTYQACFADKFLKSDSRRIVLAYKIHFRINKLANAIAEQGNQYAFVIRAKNLLWALLIQGLFNGNKLNGIVETYGQSLTMEADYSEVLKGIASSKVRFILKDAVADQRYKEMLEEEKYSFLRTKAFYQRCMDFAYERYGWTKQAL